MVNYEFLTTTGPFVFTYMPCVFAAAWIFAAFRMYLHINEFFFFPQAYSTEQQNPCREDMCDSTGKRKNCITIIFACRTHILTAVSGTSQEYGSDVSCSISNL